LVGPAGRRRPVQAAARSLTGAGKSRELVRHHPYPPPRGVRRAGGVPVGPDLWRGHVLVADAERAAQRAARRSLLAQERLWPCGPAGRDRHPAPAQRVLAEFAGAHRLGWRDGVRIGCAAPRRRRSEAHGLVSPGHHERHATGLRAPPTVGGGGPPTRGTRRAGTDRPGTPILPTPSPSQRRRSSVAGERVAPKASAEGGRSSSGPSSRHHGPPPP